jgi:tetratricopeptide (TPR) repeat protein
VRTSFVTVDFGSQPTRYRLLEPIRQYVGGLLNAAGDDRVRRHRLLRFYGDLARALEEREVDTSEVPLEPLLRELGNLRLALDCAAEDTELTDAGLRLAASMYHVWTSGFRQAEGIARLVGLLDSGGGTPAARSAAARYAAILTGQTGDTARAVALGEQALVEAVGWADPTEEQRTRRILALLSRELGDIDGARRHLALALPTRRGGLDGDDAGCLVTKACLDLDLADLDQAATAAQEVLTSNFADARWVGCTARWVLGRVMFERGDYALAESWFMEGLALAERSGSSVDVISAHLDIGLTECAAGRVEDAAAHLAAAAAVRPDRDHVWDLDFLQARAELALGRGNPGEAIGLAESALELANRGTLVAQRCWCLRILGDAQLAVGEAERAHTTFQQLVARAGVPPYPCRVAEGHEGAAASAHALSQVRVAHRHLAAALAIRQRTRTQRLRRPVIDYHLTELEMEFELEAPSP